MTQIVTDISVYTPWVARKNAAASITITCVANSAAYNLSSRTFVAEVWRFGASSAFLTATVNNGGVTGIITISFTAAQLNIAASKDYFWVLRESNGTVWFNGLFVLNSATWNGTPTTTITQTITLGGINISAAITLGGGGGGHTIQDEGVSLTQRTKLNFKGANVTVTDDVANDASVVTISGSSAVTTDNVTIQGDGSGGSPVAIKTGYLTKSVVGLSNVDNTSDVNKPVSTAQATADAAVLSSAQAFATAADTAKIVQTISAGDTTHVTSSGALFTAMALKLTTVSVDGITITGDGTAGNPLIAAGVSGALINTNNLSDVSSTATALQNLGAASFLYNIASSASAAITLAITDFAGNNSGKIKYLKTTNVNPHTITIPNDATMTLAIGSVLAGQRDTGAGTLTFSATAPATITGTSGGLLAPSPGFTWTLIKVAANTWELKNSGTPLGSANQILGVDNAGLTQEYKAVSNGLTVATGTFKFGGALTADTQLSGAFSLGLGIAPSAKFHVSGLGTTTGELVRLADNTPTTRMTMLDNGQTTHTASVIAAAIPFQWNNTSTTSAPSQALAGYEFLYTPAGTDVATATATVFRIKNTLNGFDLYNLDGSNAIHTFNGTIFNYNNGTGTGTAVIRNNNSVLSVRGGVAGSTTSIDLRANSASSTTNHNTILLTGTNFSITTALTRTHGTIQVDETTSSTNAGGIMTVTTLNLIPTLSCATGTLTLTGINYNPTITASTLTHYGMRIQSGLSAIGTTTAPTAVLMLAAGTATASTAPLKFISGTNLTTAEAGAMEYNGTNLFFTRAGTTRENVLIAVDNAAAPTATAGVVITNFYGSSATNFLGTPNRWMSINILGTVYKVALYT